VPVTFGGDPRDRGALQAFYRQLRGAPWQASQSDFLDDPLNRVRISAVLEKLLQINPHSLLDAGCGGGALLRMFADRQPEAFAAGCDFAPVNDPRFHPVTGDIDALPFSDAAFEAVVCCETLEHLPGPSGALTECRRVLAPGGRLVITVPNLFCLDSVEGRLHVFETIGRALGRAGVTPRYRNGINTHIHRLTPKKWGEIIEAGGFAIIEQQPVYTFPYIPYFLKPMKRIESALFRLSGVAETQSRADAALRFLRAGQLHLFVCEKQQRGTR
jgi:ubiquinone/menaquinone biosynthesis C-methylase UbiE